jgi:glutamate-5-semialdehyde dehydrogenase
VSAVTANSDDLTVQMLGLGEQARAAASLLARSSGETRAQALRLAAGAIRANSAKLLAANDQDMTAAKERGLSAAMLDRLALNAERVEAMALGLETIADLPDPVGSVMAKWDRPNGLVIERVRVPLGVIGIIYESRPNVTADAGGLCLKSGNAVILRGGSESYHSSRAIHACLAQALEQVGLPGAAIQMVPTTDRAAVGILLRDMAEFVDVVVPRGGKGLIQRVQDDARVPVIGHLEGLCHVYLHAPADLGMAIDLVVNAKMRRTGICGAAETLLVDRALVDTHLKAVLEALFEAGCEIRGDEVVQQIDSRVVPAQSEDWDTEYLDAVLAVAVVDDLEAAMEHIRRHGSGHTETIVTSDGKAAEQFLQGLDSAILLHNASTQFADGGEFGMGAEIGIATGKIHARGPVGAEQLTSYKYLVHGTGQIRP